MRLLDLSDDALALVVSHLMNPAREGARAIVTEQSLRVSLPLALTCRALHAVWRRCLTDLELWVSGSLTDRGLVSICAAAGRSLHRLGLRRCRLSLSAFRAIPRFCPRLRSLDLSHTPVTDDIILSLVARCGPTLQFLALHACTSLSSRALRAIADNCLHLRFLDVGAVPAVDDDTLAYLVRVRGACLRTLVLSHCDKLSDTAMLHIGTHCSALMSLTVRSLVSVTDRGLQTLCQRVGHRLQILDVLDCTGLTLGGYFSTMEAHCPHVFRYLQESNYVDHLGERCLRDNIIATMPGLIYRISATDAIRRLPALYFLLLDESTLRPFRVSVQSKSLNLSDFGTVLISNFGKKPTHKTRSVLLSRFGYDSPCDSESDDESCVRE
ncbi:unnamed protein product [Agarophyton chilense]